MNIRIITVAIFVVIILGGLSVFFMNEQNTKELAQRISPTASYSPQASSSSALLTDALTATSVGRRVSFRYPPSWVLKETTVKSGKGQFGTILQSWTLQSFPYREAGQGGIPENSAKIDIEIQSGGSNLALENLLDCGMKTTSCEIIGIDSEQFIKSEATLNTGMKMINVATFFDDRILRASALIASGADENIISTTTAILHSFTFSDTPTD